MRLPKVVVHSSITIKRKPMFLLDANETLHPLLLTHLLGSDAVGVITHKHVGEVRAVVNRFIVVCSVELGPALLNQLLFTVRVIAARVKLTPVSLKSELRMEIWLRIVESLLRCWVNEDIRNLRSTGNAYAMFPPAVVLSAETT